MPIPLVIVESPAKARTLARFLGKKYRVEASYGHIRDLPESAAEVPAEIKGKSWGRMGIDTDGDFTPYYVVPGDKKKNVTALKAAMKDASELILATDPDREGEAISWHLKELLKPKVKVRRIVFHEITEEAVKAALAEQHDVDENLVRAQESRRILDRLYGYTLSPVLWKKVQTGLSAGRVQSVAVRVIVEREEERLAFRTASYWDLEAKLRGGAIEFGATLAKIGGQRVATGKDFDSTGVLESSTVRLLDEKTATEFRDTLMRKLPWAVTSVEEKPYTQRPAPPFTTSTLQQEANRKLGYSSERTMQIAQRLFQGMDLGDGELEGLISYHRTDSTTLSNKALVEAEHAVVELYGADFHKGPRQYQTKVRNAQEAHEAIRPTDFRRTPASLERILESDEMRLYDLIWKRAVASQMADAKLLRTSVEITGETSNGTPATFNASGKAIEFAGYLRAYVEGSDDPSAELLEQDTVLPKLSVGDQVFSPDQLDQELILLALDAKGHQTSPPARYTEASLVKKLEEEGIGRPSTYAEILSKVQARDYVKKVGNKLVPSDLGRLVIERLVAGHFDLADLDFTRKLEEGLDAIAEARGKRLDILAPFHELLQAKIAKSLEEKGKWWPEAELIGEQCPDCSKDLRKRWGKNGPFIGCDGYPECKYTRPMPGSGEGGEDEDRRPQLTDMKCELCASFMMKRWGRNGWFLGCSAFPKCKFTRSVPLGVICPKCGGEVVEVRGKMRKRPFYGCKNYSNPEIKCDFRIWQKPIAEECPKCEAKLLVRAGSPKAPIIKCIKEGCDYERSAEPTDGNEPADSPAVASTAS